MYIEGHAAAFIILNMWTAGGVHVADAGFTEILLRFTSYEELRGRGEYLVVNSSKSC